jgi:hypothetical protein
MLSEAKHLAKIVEILRVAQDDGSLRMTGATEVSKNFCMGT